MFSSLLLLLLQLPCLFRYTKRTEQWLSLLRKVNSVVPVSHISAEWVRAEAFLFGSCIQYSIFIQIHWNTRVSVAVRSYWIRIGIEILINARWIISQYCNARRKEKSLCKLDVSKQNSKTIHEMNIINSNGLNSWQLIDSFYLLTIVS